MVTKTSMITRVLSALALVTAFGVTAPAHAALDYCWNSPALPCAIGGTDSKARVESALQAILGQVTEVMMIDSLQSNYFWNGQGDDTLITRTSGNGLTVTADTFQDATYGNNSHYNQGVGGALSYNGANSNSIAYVTIGTYGDRFALYEFSELFDSNTGTYRWSTTNPNQIPGGSGTQKIKSLAIWKVLSTPPPGGIPEPAPLALLMVGLTFVAWRRSRLHKGVQA